MRRTTSSSLWLPTAIGQDVREGLTRWPKSLPPWLLYDDAGSRLFEEITTTPEYYPTSLELRIFQAHAAEMISDAGVPQTIAELGVGSAYKTQVLLTALLAQRQHATFIPVDISSAALAMTTQALAPSFPTLKIEPVEGQYESVLERLRTRGGRKLVLFIGSSIGNFEPDEALKFLGQVRASLCEGDTFLLGTDLRKPPAILQAAYDDAAGVTARFNLNLLERINRELGGHFDTRRFKHVALFRPEASRVEMHLESVEAQTVEIDALNLSISFAAQERIHTENSYKFSVRSAQTLLERAGFDNLRTWCDQREWFAVHLGHVPRAHAGK